MLADLLLIIVFTDLFSVSYVPLLLSVTSFTSTLIENKIFYPFLEHGYVLIWGPANTAYHDVSVPAHINLNSHASQTFSTVNLSTLLYFNLPPPAFSVLFVSVCVVRLISGNFIFSEITEIAIINAL